ncbi:hypothetical protein AB2M62_01850 [Sphingomonas sp. MMS12-HWE2-04]|uniref:hypothetical protein n=1 Tax=Sphingomonas sp. MMS12-HWE2-04 TaxID=3234199 RepID=UPI00384F2A17
MTAIHCHFALDRVSDTGVRAILDGLGVDRDNVRALRFEASTGALLVEVRDQAAAERVESFVAGMRRTQRLVTRKTLLEHAPCRPEPGVSAAEIAASPDLALLGEGLTGLTGNALKLFRYFERGFADLARAFDAEDHHFPVMLPSTTLAEMGYFAHFPQHVTFCCHFPDSLPLLERIAAEPHLADRAAAQLSPPEHVLTPGVCLPCYRLLKGARLGSDEVRTLTMQNHVFRYEAGNFRPLARGWDFSVRDIVFFGSGPTLERLRGEVIQRAFEWCCALDLDVSIELANDPFFLDASRDKTVYQRMGEVKYELLFRLDAGEAPLAAASFNLHRGFYSSLYDIGHGDGLAESACMGFGIDRWVYGFLRQKGLDPARWPEPVRAAL